MRLLYPSITGYFRKVNWELLIFLVLVLNVKLLVKVLAIALGLFLYRKEVFQKKFLPAKFIGFYIALIAITLLNLLLHFKLISTTYLVSVSLGIAIWLLCIGAGLILLHFVKNTANENLHNTIQLFFILNLSITILQLLFVMADAGSLNPYLYQGMHQKYFISTGDRMRGISFDVSTTNALVNLMAIVYFLVRRKILLAILCVLPLLLTGSNFSNVIFCFILLYLFIFQSDRNQKSVIIVCLSLMVIFLIKISPQNNRYAVEAFQKIAGIKPVASLAKAKPPIRDIPDSLLNEEERKQKKAILYIDSMYAVRAGTGLQNIAVAVVKPVIQTPSIHSEPYQRRRDPTPLQQHLLSYAITSIPSFDSSLDATKRRTIPGKLIALRQTVNFLRPHPPDFLTGAGMGTFSSKLAFRTTALGIAGGYPEKLAYVNEAFRENHLKLYMDYFSKDVELHSLIHSPNSVYDQLLAEYGLLGLLAFCLLYLGAFLKHHKKLTYGKPLLLILLAAFCIDYWYEQLSIVILFELMLLLNIKETNKTYE